MNSKLRNDAVMVCSYTSSKTLAEFAFELQPFAEKELRHVENGHLGLI